MLKFRLAGDDIFLPAVGKFQMTTQRLIQSLGAALLHHTLAVRGITEDNAAVRGQAHLGSVPVSELDQLFHTGFFRIRHCKTNALRVVVRTQNPVIAPKFLVDGFAPGVPPHLLIHPGKFLCRKPTVQAGGAIFGDQGSFDGNGAAAAEGIPQKFSAPILGQHYHCRCQGLPQRGVVADGTITTLVQTHTGGIQVKHHPVVHQRKLQLIFFPILGQPADTILFSQPLGRGLFHDGLTIRHGHQLTVQAVTLYGECTISGDIIFQLRLIDALKQFFKSSGLKICQHQQHTLTGAQVHIGPCQSGFITGEENAAVLHPDIFNIQPAQFITGNALQAKQSGHCKFKLRHIFLHFYTFPLGGRCPARGGNLPPAGD